MRRQEKALSAFTPGRRAALASAALASLLLLLAAPVASAAKYTSGWLGSTSSGTAGGLFNSPQDIAVSTAAGHTGEVYAVDASNNRVQRFSPSGAFQRAWGVDVVSAGPGNASEFQRVSVNATGGTFALSFNAQTTGPVAFNASAANVQTELQALASIGVGNALVSGNAGGPWTVRFVGTLGGANQMQMTANATLLAGAAATATVHEVVPGGAANFEICTTTVDTCKAGVGSATPNASNTGKNGALNAPQGIAIDNDTGNVYVTDRSNFRVNVYDADGIFLRSFGQDVVAPGEPSEATVNVSETQQVSIGSAVGNSIVSGFFTLSFNGQTTAGIAHNASAATVESELVALSNIGPGDIAITGPSGGPWTVNFTGALTNTDVPAIIGNQSTLDDGFGPGVLTFVNVSTLQAGGAVPSYEVCPAIERCKIGTTGKNPGQFGSGTSLSWRPTITPADGNPSTGRVYVGDPANTRINVYFLDGSVASPSSIGSITTFATSSPTHLAVDANGILYASDGSPGSNQWVFRYNLTASTFLTPITFPFINSTTTGLEINPANNHLFVTKQSTAAAVYEFDPASSLSAPVDTHMPNAGIAASGIGLSGGAAKLFVASSTGGPRVLILDDTGAPPATVTIDPPKNVTEHTVSLVGTVNPNDTQFSVSYRFQYSKNGVSWTDAGLSTSLGSGTSPVAVSANVSGLEGNTHYRVRLLTQKNLGNPEIASAELTFITDSVKPEVSTLQAQNFTDTTATVGGSVNPNGKPTAYRFEYGETTAYGSNAPVSDGSLSGGVVKYVSEEIAGLEPGTTYHFRLVATNEEGASNGVDQTFTTRSEPASLPTRAYEQVSPTDKNGYSIDKTLGAPFGGTAVSPNGNSALFGSVGTFADGEYGLASATDLVWYQAKRSGTGWMTKAVIPRPSSGVPDAQIGVRSLNGVDGEATVIFSAQSLDGVSNPFGGLYRRELFSSGGLSSLARPLTGSGSPRLVGSTSDLSHVAFTSSDVLTTDPGVPAAGDKLYESVNGQLRLVSFDTGSVPFATAVSTGLDYTNVVSNDGEHIFFSTPTSGAGVQIYRRSNGTTTKLVSPSKRTPVDPSGVKAKTFVSATPDQGSGDAAMVFFTSAEHLTDNANTGPTRAGLDLYRYDINADSLIDISAESNTANGARVQALLGHSDDGKWVYYAALGQVLAGKGVAGQPNVYAWHDDGSPTGSTKFIATLAAATCDVSTAAGIFRRQDGCNTIASQGARISRVSRNGKSLLFQSTKSLTGYPNQDLAQVFLYEASASDGAGHLSCISCRTDGAPMQGPSFLGRSDTRALSEGELTRSLSADGGHAFFNSAEALVPEDVNGVQDVYEWEAGQLRLVSGGEGDFDSVFFSATPDGSDVFFNTFDKLVGQDLDDLRDLYDARVGGGIAAQNAPRPGDPCVADECKPAVQTQAQPPVPPSSTTPSTGNVVERKPGPAKCRKGQVKRKGKCSKRKSSKRKSYERANKTRRAGK